MSSYVHTRWKRARRGRGSLRDIGRAVLGRAEGMSCAMVGYKGVLS